MLTRLALLAVLVLASGCPKKAAYITNDHGGFTLMSKAGSMEQAVTRFQRTAADICVGRPFTLTTPIVVANGWGPMGSEIDVRSDLACQ
ncbi:MAG TPA: hypothetical protein VGR62_04625 [Candidatus Binatia bacterium]|nr:hypothetical protein [Candidatus Binatia bacterium]